MNSGFNNATIKINASKIREQHFMRLQILAFTIQSGYLEAVGNDFMIYWFKQRSFRCIFFNKKKSLYIVKYYG